MSDLAQVKTIFHQQVCELQDKITAELFKYDSNLHLIEDLWDRKGFIGDHGGGGRTRVFTGPIFENAGVNTSLVHGSADPEFLKKIGPFAIDAHEFWAAGISLIIHPKNPKIPTVHANFRMVEVGGKFWFGGGADLTPYYPHEEDFSYFHGVWKKACLPYGSYQKMKKECDQYFVNHHRGQEMRGIGGIFFDHYNSGNLALDFKMVIDLSSHFISSYFPIVEKRINEQYNFEDEEFQLQRRGRYVEFNLLHDRGTLFGLKTNGRTDSILVSLPARCTFAYQYKPQKEIHQQMMNYYYPKEW